MKKLFLIVFMALSLVVAGQSTVFAIAQAGVTAGSSVESAYWQTNADTFTFIAITNNSISGNASRAVTVNAIHADETLAGTSLTFTIDRGKTERVFIMATGRYSAAYWTVAGDENLIQTSNSPQGGLLVINTPYGAYAGFLSVFGAIFNPTTYSGFAMEFIGDKVDSIKITGGESAVDRGAL